MRVLILQLSDIHLAGADDPIVNRAPRIPEAVRNLEDQLDLCVLLLSGDVANRGSDAEYMLALDLVQTIVDGLKVGIAGAPPIEVVALPGNHDCDFSVPLGAREMIVASLANSESPSADPQVIEVCTGVQDAFFAFRDAVSDSAAPEGDRLCYTYRFRAHDRDLVVRCINTAWVSRLREVPGALAFPTAHLPEGVPEAAAIVTAFHHPYGWLPPAHARAFRKRVEETSDLILTGHEHDATLREQASSTGLNVYLEGGALQERGVPKESAFNAIVLDTAAGVQRIIRFQWDGERYSRAGEDSTWEPFAGRRLRARQQYEPQAAHQAWLEDLGVQIQHPSRGELKLDDVFVFPDLFRVGSLISLRSGEAPAARRAIGSPAGGRMNIRAALPSGDGLFRPTAGRISIRGEDLLEEMERKPRILLTGPERSGKTSLVKVLIRRMLAGGYVPVLLDGRSIDARAPDRFTREVERAFTSQYRADALEPFRQLDRSRKVLILDDAHRLMTRGQPLGDLVRAMCGTADRVLVLANDLAFSLGEALGQDPAAGDFEHLQIQPFGHQRRTQLAEQWFSLDEGSRNDPPLLSRKVVEVKRITDTVIGRNFVPAFPVFLLPLLYAYSSNEQVDLGMSAYGYYYEILIRRQLASGSSVAGFDIKLGYLTHLAFTMFTLGRETLQEHELREVHGNYEAEYGLTLHYANTLRELEDRGILQPAEGGYAFRYRYIFYYFVAKHLADHIAEPETRALIQELIAKITEEEIANIVLFLAHLSKDPMIAAGLLAAAESIFQDRPPADLREKTVPSGEARRAVRELKLLDRATPENRRSLMERLDSEDDAATELEHIAGAHNEEMQEVQRLLQPYIVAYRTQQILGQTVKNFPGHIKKDDKLHVIRACTQLGLRTLAELFGYLEANASTILEAAAEGVKEREPHADAGAVTDQALRHFHSLTLMVAVALIRRSAWAVGAPELKPIYAVLKDEADTPALRLVATAIRLEQFGDDLPVKELTDLGGDLDKERLAREVLRLLVHNHLNLFETKIEQKQQLCSALDIAIVPIQRADRRKMLMERGSQKAD